MGEKTVTGAACGIPSSREMVLAERAVRTLDALPDVAQPVSVQFGAETVEIPGTAVQLLRRILEHMAHGEGVAITTLNAELTTRQAAGLLQVSRTHLVHLIEEGRISFRTVGFHRRIRVEDLLAYRSEAEFRRREALDELTALDQELGLQ